MTEEEKKCEDKNNITFDRSKLCIDQKNCGFDNKNLSVNTKFSCSKLSNQINTTVNPLSPIDITALNDKEKIKLKMKKKTKFIDEVDPTRQLVEIINVPSFKSPRPFDDEEGEDNSEENMEEAEEYEGDVNKDNYMSEQSPNQENIIISAENGCKYCTCIII